MRLRLDHGTISKRAGFTTTAWEPSRFVSSLQPLGPGEKEFNGTTRMRCSHCPAEFVYKTRRPKPPHKPLPMFGATLATLVLICVLGGDGTTILAVGVIMGITIAAVAMLDYRASKPPQPHFQQVKAAPDPLHPHRVVEVTSTSNR